LDKSEKYGVLILWVLILGLMINKFFLDRNIDDNPVFVIGHMQEAVFAGAETGWVFDFVYTYNNQQYYTSIGGPVNKSTVKDSLIYFKISADKPQLSMPVMGQWVPPCVVKEGQPLLGWKEIPYCK